MRKIVVSTLGLVLGSMVLAGCTAMNEQPQATSATNAQHAECLVCKHDADLACVDVTVEKDTPSYVHAGNTYYFCSDTCKDKFAKTPEKYIAKK